MADLNQDDIIEYIQTIAKTSNIKIREQLFQKLKDELDKNPLLLELNAEFKDAFKNNLIDAIIDYRANIFIPIYMEYIGDDLFINTEDDLTASNLVNIIDIDDFTGGDILPTKPPISAEKLVLLENEAKERYKKNQLFKLKSKQWLDNEKIINKTRIFNPDSKDTRIFKVGEIIGAQDINCKWWLSRILDIYKDNSCCASVHYPLIWYYVHFEGHSDFSNEWILHGKRIQKYNAKKHFYKREDFSIDSLENQVENVSIVNSNQDPILP
jgi:hypothetical protein